MLRRVRRKRTRSRDNRIIGTKRVNFEDAGQEVCVRLVSLFGDPFLITVNEKGREGEKRGGRIEVAVMQQRVEGCQRWQRGPLTLVSYLSIEQRVGGRDKGSS